MKFFKRKRFLSIFFAITVALGIGFLLNITHNSKQSISENEVRSQLEQMYAAEVANVTMKQDVYNAVITKSGTFYLVEMNAVTGDVYSVEQTDEYVIEKPSSVTEETLEILEKPLINRKHEANSMAEVEMVKLPTKITISEKSTNSNTKTEVAETPKSTEIVSPKGVKSSQSKIQEKPAEEKPMKEVIKDAIKDVLKPEPSKTEETKEEKAKDEAPKTDVSKTDVTKTDSVKDDSSKMESSKTDDLKLDETQVTVVQPPTTQSEEKKPESVPKTEQDTTILISEEQAIKTAQQQIKGIVESNSFVKTNEGGYYLIVMKASLAESDLKNTAQAKKTKATIQVHAISGKILSVTWE